MKDEDYIEFNYYTGTRSDRLEYLYRESERMLRYVEEHFQEFRQCLFYFTYMENGRKKKFKIHYNHLKKEVHFTQRFANSIEKKSWDMPILLDRKQELLMYIIKAIRYYWLLNNEEEYHDKGALLHSYCVDNLRVS